MIRAIEIGKENERCFNRQSILRLDNSEIWTGSHLSQLRLAVSDWRELHREESLTIDLSSVKHVPTGFFGYLCDLHDEGVRVDLYEAHESIQNLIWFKRFFRPGRRNTHRFREQPDYMP